MYVPLSIVMFELRNGLTLGKILIIGNSQALTGSDGVTGEVKWGHHASGRPRVISASLLDLITLVLGSPNWRARRRFAHSGTHSSRESSLAEYF